MDSIRKAFLWLAIAAFCAGAVTVAPAQQVAEQVTIAFSDPSRPGTLRMRVMQGSITIRGTNRTDVAIEARPRPEVSRSRAVRRGADTAAPDASGLRRLTPARGFRAEEENNVMSVSSSAAASPVDFEVQVPARTDLKLSAMNAGDIVVEGVDGDLEVENLNGPITLTNVAGSVVAHALNGNVLARLARVTAGKAMAFTSLNGNIDVTLPSSVNASLKLRSDRGDIFTDFDVQLTPAASPTVRETRARGGRFQLEVNRTILGSINGGGPEIEMRTFNGSVYLRKAP